MSTTLVSFEKYLTERAETLETYRAMSPDAQREWITRYDAYLVSMSSAPERAGAVSTSPQLRSVSLELHDIDGTIATLACPRGFRKYVQQRAEFIGMTGEIIRIPRVNAKVYVVGTQLQHDQFAEFIKSLQSNNFVKSVVLLGDHLIDQNYAPLAFEIRRSERARVITGRYSDPKLDNVTPSQSSADRPMSRGAPSPHDLRTTRSASGSDI